VAGPLAQAAEWLAYAAGAGAPEADAGALATAGADARPSVRFVLVKGIDARGVRFFTNHGSRKGRELEVNPVAALAMWWPSLQRQLRVEGPVERLPAAESDEYFASRSRGSQLGAWASRQGSAIGGREELEARVAELGARFGEEVPRPQWWRAARTASTTARTSCARPVAGGGRSGSRRSPPFSPLSFCRLSAQCPPGCRWQGRQHAGGGVHSGLRSPLL
jgi:pyridoxamine 5'-phosphate oxidase